MSEFKVAVVGGASSYMPELADGLIKSYDELPITELALTDIHEHRLEIVGGLTQRMFDKAELPVRVTMSLDRKEALEGAAFVNAVIRVGGMDARALDERLPLKYGIIGQETTGPGGMMNALRTIPAMLEVAHDMEKVCPDAWLINYTNPSGIITEAVSRHSEAKIIGLCAGTWGWGNGILDTMGIKDKSRVTIDWLGLNHLVWAIHIWMDGQDVIDEAVEAMAQASWGGHDPDWLRALGVIPCSGYLRIYYLRSKVVQERQAREQTRAEVLKELEVEMLRQYADPNLAERPDLLDQRGGGGYSTVAVQTMTAILHNRNERQVVNVPTGGAVEGLPKEAVAELPCMVGQDGATPLHVGEIPLQIRGLLQAVKTYETLTVQAAVEGSKRLALQALMAHPLVGDADVAKPLLAELLEANKPFLPWV
jgi:6-phospho-beta-glucosidase